MEITETRIKLAEDTSDGNSPLRAFVSITLDGMFVVRDIMIIAGAKGLFVVMPSRKLADHCRNCGTKNHLQSRYCNRCGTRIGEHRAMKDDGSYVKLHADVAHPINTACREMIQRAVLDAYAEEIELARVPGYVSRYDRWDSEGAEVEWVA